MAMNYASKYSQLVDEKFAEVSATEQAVNREYDYNGVQSVVVYDVNTVSMNDYTASGTNRYGVASELGNGTQTLTVSQDRSFTFTIDRKNHNDTQMVMEAGKALSRQLEQVAIPEVDQYRLAKMLFSAGALDGEAITTDNAYEKFLDARAQLRRNKVPVNGILAYVSTGFYKKIKQDDSFVKQGDIAQNLLLTGQIGRIDNIAIIEQPDEYLMGASFILTHPVATTAVKKIEEYKIHDNPPGISGWLVEGRMNYDAFVRENKKGAIYGQIANINTVSVAGTSGKTILSSNIELEIAINAGFVLKYKSGAASLTPAVLGDNAAGFTAYTPGDEATITATHEVQLVLVDASDEVVVPGTVVVAVLGA